MMVDLVDKLVDIFKSNEKNLSYKRQKLIQQFITITEYIFKIGMTLYILSTSFYAVYPTYKYVYFNEIVPLITLYVPFLDENTITGFAYLTIYHLTIIISALMASACADFIFPMIAVNVLLMGNIIDDDIQTLNELLASDRPDPVMIKIRLKNIFLQHQEIIE